MLKLFPRIGEQRKPEHGWEEGWWRPELGCIMSHVWERKQREAWPASVYLVGSVLHPCLVDVMLHDLKKILPETEVRAHRPFEPTLCAPGFNSSSWPVSLPLLSILPLSLFSFSAFYQTHLSFSNFSAIYFSGKKKLRGLNLKCLLFAKASSQTAV